ncbi:MAG: HEPN domain-containing protein, partial [Anaerolineae bacterium]|nr:HEPN domain-containing protein [Anaerolineae bacterium]
FFYNVSRYGVEVYSMDAGEMKRVMVEGLARLAEEYLESAREVLERGRLRLAIDAGYNAAELAAKALILRKQDDVPGSHGGIVSLFGALYVKTGEADAELGRRLNRALQLRNEARYRPGARLAKEDAEEVIRLAQALLALVTPCWETPNISTEQL